MGYYVSAVLAEVLFLNHSAPGNNVLQIQSRFCSSSKRICQMGFPNKLCLIKEREGYLNKKILAMPLHLKQIEDFTSR